VYPAHFALTDVKNGEFFHAELISREGPGLAAAAEDDLGVHVRDWSAERVGERIHVKARDRGYALQLVLEPLRPVVLHGRNGYSRKGAVDTQASYYYSFTRLRAAGSLTFKGISHEVSGYAWMDHEFGSSMLTPEQVGWDWFSLQLDDESDLMLFHLRQKDGSAEPTFGTLVRPDGHVVELAGRSISISTTETWTSPRSPAKYPSAWNVEIPSEGISLNVAASVADQELVTGGSTAITYWEGAVHIKGTRNGRTVRGRGYVELTGYAHSLKGRL